MSWAETREEICGFSVGLRGVGFCPHDEVFLRSSFIVPTSSFRIFAASQSRAKCSGIVPQHPPTMFTPNSFTNRIIPLTKSGGVMGNFGFPSTMIGRPALGRQLVRRG